MATAADSNTQDFRAHLVEQLAFLDASARAYDGGIESEAKRLATTIRVLVHDGRPPGRSLLSHLEVRDRLPWTDTAAGIVREAVLALGSGLCITRIETGTGRSRFAAPLGNLPPERFHPGASFIDWWDDAVLTDADGTQFSRRALVLAVANKDGGAHVDAKLPADYTALTRDNSIGITQATGSQPNTAGLCFGIAISGGGLAPARTEGERLDNSLALAHVRQIAWELSDTVRRHLVLNAPAPYVRAPICSLTIHEPVHADRDGRCPCGSGRSLARCFGLRRPRRTFSVHGLARGDQPA